MTTPTAIVDSVVTFKRDRTQPVHSIAANEMCRLWQAHGILELVVNTIGDELASERPQIKQALRAAADIVRASIDALEPICTPRNAPRAKAVSHG